MPRQEFDFETKIVTLSDKSRHPHFFPPLIAGSSFCHSQAAKPRTHGSVEATRSLGISSKRTRWIALILFLALLFSLPAHAGEEAELLVAAFGKAISNRMTRLSGRQEIDALALRLHFRPAFETEWLIWEARLSGALSTEKLNLLQESWSNFAALAQSKPVAAELRFPMMIQRFESRNWFAEALGEKGLTLPTREKMLTDATMSTEEEEGLVFRKSPGLSSPGFPPQATGYLGTPLTGGSPAQTLEKEIARRIQRGELKRETPQHALAADRTARERFDGKSLLDPGAQSCSIQWPAKTFERALTLASKARGGSPAEVVSNMADHLAKELGMSSTEARQRICRLAGMRASPCRFFGEVVRMGCQP